jgi:translation initiation factor eIF-2B subunit gamma
MDVTAIDESTLQPIYKESAKQKKGLLSRDEDDIFYMAIQTTTGTTNHGSTNTLNNNNNNCNNTSRLIWKQSKFDVEEDKEQIGTTPKLKIPKFRLYGGINSIITNNPMLRRTPTGSTDTITTRISTEWNDVHCYCLSSWVWEELCHQPKFQSLRYQSLQYDFIPLLISRQYRGISATFSCTSSGSTATTTGIVTTTSNTIVVPPPTATRNTLPTTDTVQNDDNPSSLSLPTAAPAQPAVGTSTTTTTTTATVPQVRKNDEYMVMAHVSNTKTIASTTPSIFRSHTIASYLFANRIMTHEISALNVTSLQQQQQQQQQSSSFSMTTHTNGKTQSLFQLPDGATIQSKNHTILLPESQIGDKVTLKSCVIGKHCRIGHNCRLNNVVLHDYVTIGDNTTLQSTIVSAHVTIGDHCNFNDCQILHHLNIPSNTKKKGEAITSIDE